MVRERANLVKIQKLHPAAWGSRRYPAGCWSSTWNRTIWREIGRERKRDRESKPGKDTEDTSCSVEVEEISRRVLELDVEQDSLDPED